MRVGEPDQRGPSRAVRSKGWRGATLLLALVVCACSERAPSSAAPRAPATDSPPPAPSPAASATAETQPADASALAAIPAAPSLPAPEPAPQAPEGAPTSFASWWEAHSKSPPPANDEVGRPLRLGEAKRPAFLSARVELPEAGRRGGPRHTYRALRFASVWVVQASQPRRVLDLPVAFDVMDKDDLDEPPLFELSIRQDLSDGAIVVEEPEARPCAVAQSELSIRRAAERDPTALAWIDFDTSLLGRVCRSVGRHAWEERSGRFVRASSPGSTASQTSASGPRSE